MWRAGEAVNGEDSPGRSKSHSLKGKRPCRRYLLLGYGHKTQSAIHGLLLSSAMISFSGPGHGARTVSSGFFPMPPHGRCSPCLRGTKKKKKKEEKYHGETRPCTRNTREKKIVRPGTADGRVSFGSRRRSVTTTRRLSGPWRRWRVVGDYIDAPVC